MPFPHFCTLCVHSQIRKVHKTIKKIYVKLVLEISKEF